MNKHYISVTKTARYFTYGQPGEHIRKVWVVCHGYGQLASYFLKKCACLTSPDSLIVAPEALNKFYWQGFSGMVVAAWMTKEDREQEINDYVNYLDKVLAEVLANCGSQPVRVNLLGFSQGGATVARWIMHGAVKPDALVIWAGAFPDEMMFGADKFIRNGMKLYMVVGDEDEFGGLQKLGEYEDLLTRNGVSFRSVIFKGKHDIHDDTLSQISLEIG